jgi:hypothetical protein
MAMGWQTMRTLHGVLPDSQIPARAGMSRRGLADRNLSAGPVEAGLAL